MKLLNLYMQRVNHLKEQPNCTYTTYELSLLSEVPAGYQFGMLYDLVIEQVKHEDVWWLDVPVGLAYVRHSYW